MSMQLQVPDTLTERYDVLAQQIGQQPENVMLKALESYLLQIAIDDARLVDAIAAADRGEVVDAEAVSAENVAYLRSRGVTEEQLAVIGSEVKREVETFYGISTCE